MVCQEYGKLVTIFFMSSVWELINYLYSDNLFTVIFYIHLLYSPYYAQFKKSEVRSVKCEVKINQEIVALK